MSQDQILRHDLHLRDPFGISRGSASVIPVIHVLTAEGGIGCGSPVRYHGETAEAVAADARRLLDALRPEDRAVPELWEAAMAHTGADTASSARVAVDMALHDARARRLGQPLHEVLGSIPVRDKPSTFTIALDSDDVMVEKARRAASAPALKIKLGRDDTETDARTLGLLRREVPEKALVVDANAGWSRETAGRMVRVCADLGVELVEQPLAIGDVEGLRALKADSPIPFVVDEDAQTAADLPRLRGATHGINIKLMKCGSLREALKMLDFARDEGWLVMVGCMIESGVGIAAAAHLAGGADRLDLDAEALVSHKTTEPAVLGADWKVNAPEGPGLGVRLLDM